MRMRDTYIHRSIEADEAEEHPKAEEQVGDFFEGGPVPEFALAFRFDAWFHHKNTEPNGNEGDKA